MEKLQLKVFNVGHGLSIMFRELPEEYITLIDLGADNQTSPLELNCPQKVRHFLEVRKWDLQFNIQLT